MIFYNGYDGNGRKKTRKTYIHEKQGKNPPFGFPPIPPSIKLEADCFPGRKYRKLAGPTLGGEGILLYRDKRNKGSECYAIQAFSIASDFDPQLMPKIQNQITMRKVCIVIQSLVSRRPNHHSGYS